MEKRSRIVRIVLIGSLARIYGKAYQQQPGIDRNNQLSSLQRQTLSLHAGPPWERENWFISKLGAIVHKAGRIASQKRGIIRIHNPPQGTQARLYTAPPWPLRAPHTWLCLQYWRLLCESLRSGPRELSSESPLLQGKDGKGRLTRVRVARLLITERENEKSRRGNLDSNGNTRHRKNTAASFLVVEYVWWGAFRKPVPCLTIMINV